MRRPDLWKLLAAFAVLAAVPTHAKDPKLTAKEVLARHLEAIGSAEARAKIAAREATGTGRVVFRLGGTGQLEGQGGIVSQGDKVRLGVIFNATEYPGEHVAFDGDKVTVGTIRAGVRSNLSNFLYTHDILLREGLLFGVCSSSWALLTAGERGSKLDYSGLKKVEGRQLHEMKYRARKGSGDLRITLYFEPETFRHVQSIYKLTIPAVMGATPEQSAQMRETRFTLSEFFSEFKEVDGLTLPHGYKLDFTYEGQNQTILTSWTLTFDKIAHNTNINPAVFTIQ